MTRVLEVGLIDLSIIQEELTLSEFYGVILNGYYSFQQHYFLTCVLHSHNIGALRLRIQVTEPPDKVKTSVLIGGLHTAPSDFDGDAEIAEKEPGDNYEGQHPDQQCGCQLR